MASIAWREERPPSAPDRDIEVDDSQVGGGYGVPTASSTEALELVARREGILLDPVYTAKAMAGLIARVRQGEFNEGQTVLFWHTGGQVGTSRDASPSSARRAPSPDPNICSRSTAAACSSIAGSSRDSRNCASGTGIRCRFARRSIHAVILTHAHLDHCGYLPRLVGQGFRGRIFCTPATADLARIVLADAAKIQEEDAERANRKGYTSHQPALPLFTSEDADRAMTLLQPVGYERPDARDARHHRGVHQRRPPARIGVRARAHRGVGQDHPVRRRSRPLRRVRCCPIPPPVAEADVLLVESTYGDRVHEPDDDGAPLAEVINETVRAPRQSDHSGVRARPRRRAALLDETARRAARDSGDCPSTWTVRWRRSARGVPQADRRARRVDLAPAGSDTQTRTRSRKLAAFCHGQADA